MNFIIYYILSQAFSIGSAQRIEVKVQQGTVLGTRETTVFDDKLFFAFYGVPYARVPVGRLRFKDPKPPKKWRRPFDARTEHRRACAQAHIVHKHALYGNEDCLHLNIYTPSLPYGRYVDLKPVIVWIHGYAFTSSFSHVHGADFLIDNDVLFISLTHRIGAFGFSKANDDDANANMGLKDIALALKWIRRNVKEFGGDRDRITMMGVGSAATYIALLMTTKHKKLFSKAILQSGSLFSPSIFQSDYKLERNRLIHSMKGFSLLNATTKEIVRHSQRIYTKRDIINFQRPVVPFSPVIEKASNVSVITDRSLRTYKGADKPDFGIPVMIGYSSQESITESMPFLNNPIYLRKLNAHFKFMVPFVDGCKLNGATSAYNEVAVLIKHEYFNGTLSEHTLSDFLRYASDLRVYPVHKLIRGRVAAGGSVYVYKFDYIGGFNAARANSVAGAGVKVGGAAEGDEICYILKCEPLWESYVRLKRDVNDPDRIFMKHIAAMWARFAKFGDPVRGANVTWPPMSETEDRLFLFGESNRVHDSKAEGSMYKFWNDLYDNYFDVKHCSGAREEL